MRVRDLFFKLQLPLATLASPLNQTWDYIIVGAGAAGIPIADRLSESGKSVLLVERGWASSGRWGGTVKPSWLEGTNLTRFDVPALYQFIWTNDTDNSGILCPDVSVPASCVLGGGTAVNAGQFYKPHKDDWDTSMPSGWRSEDMVSATQKAFSRLLWTETPSQDNKSYLTNGSSLALSALTNPSYPNPYTLIRANTSPSSKNHTTSPTEFFFLNGERGGPMATYLVSASRRPTFHLLLNTTVSRILRTGSLISGVQVSATHPGGTTGTIHTTPRTGRVILSAGVFNTAKLLFRSGIGPTSHLATVHAVDGPAMINPSSWIRLPVGRYLDDAPSVYLAIRVPGLEPSAWETLYNAPDPMDVQRYLSARAGPLAEIQPSLSPTFWDTYDIPSSGNETSSDMVVQWSVTSTSLPDGVLAFSATLARGKRSRGALGIDSSLTMRPTILPYFNDAAGADYAVLNASAHALWARLLGGAIPGASAYLPAAGQGLDEYLRGAVSGNETLGLSSNHWVGSARMGEVCGDEREVVVDVMTRVCGTENLHVVDASIVNGVPSSNPQGVLVVAAERAAEVILGLDE
ncbi:FAD/NAD(P)-binding domain-containing protein [Polyplosphaeria fusca]|uniref:FAD/NAD(P)-binding domain-containing protein n=1 Tax=Polyplosphaeria fusca TaxID=682080 RepID=A0A9P4R303_9PLEO|nr:FAD/NAD(P)-binding domain-containing protein [Polyplosphaeria fusca]